MPVSGVDKAVAVFRVQPSWPLALLNLFVTARL
jgi:hypothetical protein